MGVRSNALLISFLVVQAAGWSLPARAQGAVPHAMDAPWVDVPPAIDPRGFVVSAALGIADERLGRLSARQTDARRRGEERARRALHAWADDALAGVRASAAVAAGVHRAIDAHASITRVRGLSDGNAIVEIAVPLAILREVASLGGLPWSQ
jgi:hypothetical protein